MLWIGGRGNCPRGQPVGEFGRGISAKNSRGYWLLGYGEDHSEPSESKTSLEGLI